jgi:hypothetical protein
MILDKVLHGVLDQGRGCLLVFDEPETDVSHHRSLHFVPSFVDFNLLCPLSRTHMARRSTHLSKSERSSIHCMQRCVAFLFPFVFRLGVISNSIASQTVKIA